MGSSSRTLGLMAKACKDSSQSPAEHGFSAFAQFQPPVRDATCVPFKLVMSETVRFGSFVQVASGFQIPQTKVVADAPH